MKKYIVALGLSKMEDKFLLLGTPMILENGKLRKFMTYPNLEIYNYICQFVKPDVFIIHNCDVIIYTENQEIEKIVKSIKFPKFISNFNYKNHTVYTYEVEGKIFYLFNLTLENILKEILEKVGVDKELIKEIIDEIEISGYIDREIENSCYRIFTVEYPDCFIIKDKHIQFGFCNTKIVVVKKQ